jgi:hypothetical protein
MAQTYLYSINDPTLVIPFQEFFRQADCSDITIYTFTLIGSASMPTFIKPSATTNKKGGQLDIFLNTRKGLLQTDYKI